VKCVFKARCVVDVRMQIANKMSSSRAASSIETAEARLALYSECVQCEGDDVVLVDEHKSADRLGDAILMVNGHEVHCNVVHVQSSDLKRVPSNDYLFDETIWIDKARETVLRTMVHADAYMVYGAARIPLEEQIITTFTTTELNGGVREDLFRFNLKLV
jgi:hypothetical protein